MCSFCHTETKTTLYIFHKCSATKIFWNQLLLYFETDLDFTDLTPQAALFGFANEPDNNLNILQNHILLIFKLSVYQSRERGILNLNSLIKNATKVKKLERKIASVCEKKTIQFDNKWKSTDLKITAQSKDICTEEFLSNFMIMIVIVIIVLWVFLIFFSFTSKLVFFITLTFM